MADPLIDAAAAKDTAPAAPPSPAPTQPPVVQSQPQPAPQPAPVATVAAPYTPPVVTPAPAQAVPDIAAKVKELDDALARAKAREIEERNKRTLSVLRSMGAVGSDATMLMLAGSVDPDTADGRAKLDRLRELEPLLFRALPADTRTAVAAAVTERKAPAGYTGRYDDAYAKRIAEGAVRRAMGGE